MSNYEFVKNLTNGFQKNAIEQFGKQGEFPGATGALSATLCIVLDMICVRDEELGKFIINHLKALNPEIKE